MPRQRIVNTEAPEDKDEDLLDEDLEELATGRSLDASDLDSLHDAEDLEDEDDDHGEEDEDDWGRHREEDDDWTREAWTDYMSTRAAVRADGGNGGSFFYE